MGTTHVGTTNVGKHTRRTITANYNPTFPCLGNLLQAYLMPSLRTLTRDEIYVVAGLGVLTALWLFMPAIAQPEGYHQFADARALFGIPNAADVLSNLAFVAVGLRGLYRLQQGIRPLSPVVRLSLNVFFLGFFLTGFGSAYYHWNPNNQTLVGDRLLMTIVFAGLFGALLSERVNARSGLAVLLLALVVGPVSVFYWKATADLSPYVVGQFGGMAAIVLLLTLTPKGRDPFPWWTLIAWYGVAKILEAGDVFVWNATRELLAGHTLKHLTAAMGGLAIANALRRPAAAIQVTA